MSTLPMLSLQITHAVQKLGVWLRRPTSSFESRSGLKIEMPKYPYSLSWYVGLDKGQGWVNARGDQVDYYNA